MRGSLRQRRLCSSVAALACVARAAAHLDRRCAAAERVAAPDAVPEQWPEICTEVVSDDGDAVERSWPPQGSTRLQARRGEGVVGELSRVRELQGLCNSWRGEEMLVEIIHSLGVHEDGVSELLLADALREAVASGVEAVEVVGARKQLEGLRSLGFEPCIGFGAFRRVFGRRGDGVMWDPRPDSIRQSGQAVWRASRPADVLAKLEKRLEGKGLAAARCGIER
mmetsp:Transcript_113853/g.318016  ORF Transcript_113853/g.318016 Transcript_113853/m.318016 type:complete len:224 (+) Transcript_113853:46-717(+)